MTARRILGRAWTVLAGIGMAWAAFVAILWLLQGRMMYPARGTREAMHPGWERIDMGGLDGGRIAYRLPPRPGRPTVVFLHGNATDYGGDVVATQGFADRGVGIMIPEYPGFGGMDGRPDEKGIDAQADLAYDWLLAHGTRPEDVIVYGNSIGSGPAVHLARRPHAVLALVSPVASMEDVVHRRMPYVPTGLVADRWRNAEALKAVRGPVFVMHARDDATIPFSQGEEMARAAHGKVLAFKDGGHAIAFDPAVAQMVAIDAIYLWQTKGADAAKPDPKDGSGEKGSRKGGK